MNKLRCINLKLMMIKYYSLNIYFIIELQNQVNKLKKKIEEMSSYISKINYRELI